MDSFYFIVLIIACVILILALIVFSMMLKKANADTTFPLTSRDCPDGWDPSGNRCYTTRNRVTTKNFLSNCDDTSNTIIESSVPVNGTADAYVIFKTATRCDKKKWADLYNIHWDGVTNYNQC